jgi:hypothetical protein
MPCRPAGIRSREGQQRFGEVVHVFGFVLDLAQRSAVTPGSRSRRSASSGREREDSQ